jgi:hypothetical protein
MSTSFTLLKASIDQDKAAGGIQNRKLKIRSGDIVTASLTTSNAKSPFRVVLRFKSGLTIQREAGFFEAASAAESIRKAWKEIRGLQIAEREGWTWITPAPGQ